MARTSILFGVLLIALGLGGYFATGQKDWLALLPAVLGAAMAVLGLLCIKESFRKNAMHAVLGLGLLGFATTVPGLVRLGRKVLEEPGLVVQSAMALLCGVFLVLALKSFLDARRSRRPTAANPPAVEPRQDQQG